MSTQFLGRVIWGNSSKDLMSLSNNPDRRVVFFLPHAELTTIIKADTPMSILKKIGWSELDMDLTVRPGNSFQLVLFPQNDTIARLATWDNVFQIINEAYPDFADHMNRHRDALRRTPYESIVEMAGYQLNTIDRNDTRYMSPERYKLTDKGLVATRSFLEHTIHLNGLFTGDGYTRTTQGEKGIQEYIGLNRVIRDIPDFEVYAFKFSDYKEGKIGNEQG